MRRCLHLLSLWLLVSTGLYAEGPAFDLAGPKVDVHVKRGTVTLPISETPNLLAGIGCGFIPTCRRASQHTLCWWWRFCAGE